MLREFARSARERGALVEGTGVRGPQPGEEITLGQQLQLIRNLNAHAASGWAHHIGRRFVLPTHGAVGFGSVSAPSLGEGLALVERFGHVRAPFFRYHSRRDGDHHVLSVEDRIGLTNEERIPLHEMLAFTLQSLVETLLGPPMRDAVLHFAYGPPPHAAEYASSFQSACRFDASETTIAIPSSWLRHASPMADSATYENSLRQLEALDRRLESDDYIVARVEQLIETSRTGVLSFAAAAMRLHLSERTLIRRLRHQGATYTALLDAYRRDKAGALLRDPQIDIQEISHRLGYSDLTGLGRACRRWFGVSPHTYRRRAEGQRASTPRPASPPPRADLPEREVPGPRRPQRSA
jgi:AraC-like DNA-binding protein